VRRDHCDLPTRLPRRGVLRQPLVSRPWRLPAEVRQLVLTVEIENRLLPSVLLEITPLPTASTDNISALHKLLSYLLSYFPRLLATQRQICDVRMSWGPAL